jgi:hypothetical protein
MRFECCFGGVGTCGALSGVRRLGNARHGLFPRRGPLGSAFCILRETAMSHNDSPESKESKSTRENKMWETAKLLVDIAVKTQMTIYDVDRETARDWVVRAAKASVGKG